MRIKLDENLSGLSVEPLRTFGHDVDTVRDEGLTGPPDDDIWAGAQASERILVTCDLDFSDIRRFTLGAHHGLVILRLRDATRSALEARLAEVFNVSEETSWARCFVIVSDHRVRAFRPGSV